MKVISYNIHKGLSIGNRRTILDPLRNLIRSTDADFVCLQEVVQEHSTFAKRHPCWINEAQFEFLADQVWHHYAYGKNAVYPAGNHGNAVLSKYPVKRFFNLDLSIHRLEQRGLLHCEIQADLGNLHILSTHLDLLAINRNLQVSKIHSYIEERIPHNEPVILAGDFNDWQRYLIRSFEDLGLVESSVSTKLNTRATFPAFLPVLSLDRIYTRGVNVKHAEVLVGDRVKGLSDHLPMVLEFL